MHRGVGKRGGGFRGGNRGFRGGRGFRGSRGRGGGFRGRSRGRGHREDYHTPSYSMFNQRGRGGREGYRHGPSMGHQQASQFMATNTRQTGGRGRMKLSNFPIAGKVISFHPEKGFGWIRPTQPVGSLAGVHSNGERVFVHVSDLVGMKTLEQDQDVRFDLYSDVKGLGAQNCTSNEAPEGMDNYENHDQNFGSSGGDIPDGFTDDPRTVISIFVENMHIGGIIGKKGATIKKLSEDSQAKIWITPEDKDDETPQKRDPQRSRLITLTGTSDQLKKVVKAITKTLSEISQSLYAKITFLIHQTQVGRLIGKKGVNIKQIQGEKRTVNLNISKEPVEISGQPLVTVSVFGPCKDVEESIEEMVNQLTEIYQSMLQNYTQAKEQEMAQQQQHMGYGGPPMDGGYGHAAPGGYQGGGHHEGGYGHHQGGYGHNAGFY